MSRNPIQEKITGFDRFFALDLRSPQTCGVHFWTVPLIGSILSRLKGGPLNQVDQLNFEPSKIILLFSPYNAFPLSHQVDFRPPAPHYLVFRISGIL